MFGERIGRQRARGKVAALACLFGRLERTTNDTTAEGQHHLLLLWLGVDTHQLSNLDLQPRLFIYLAEQRLVDCFACFHTSARKVPPVDIAPVPQEDATFIVKDEGKDADAEDGREIGAELAIWIAFMQQDYLHRPVVGLLKHITQMQGITQAHIGIAIAIAGMELNWKLLLRCIAESDVQQVIQERLVSDT